MDAVDTDQARRSRRRSVSRLWRRLIVAVRDGDEHTVEQAVLQLAGTRKIFAPLALIVGAFVMLFSALRLLVTNWRLMLVQALPALLIWAVTLDLKAHVLHGKEFNVIRGPIVVVLFVLAVLVTIGAFFLNAAFAFTISRSGAPDLKAGFWQARRHARAVIGWGGVIGLALGVAAILVPRWGLRWFALSLGIVLAVMMVCYVAVPASSAYRARNRRICRGAATSWPRLLSPVLSAASSARRRMSYPGSARGSSAAVRCSSLGWPSS